MAIIAAIGSLHVVVRLLIRRYLCDFGMAAFAGLGGAFKYAANVAGLTGHLLVGAIEDETGIIVIEFLSRLSS